MRGSTHSSPRSWPRARTSIPSSSGATLTLSLTRTLTRTLTLTLPGTPLDRIVVGGFSQGGALALFSGLQATLARTP